MPHCHLSVTSPRPVPCLKPLGNMCFGVQSLEDFRKAMRYIPCIVLTPQQGLVAPAMEHIVTAASPAERDQQRPAPTHPLPQVFEGRRFVHRSCTSVLMTCRGNLTLVGKTR